MPLPAGQTNELGSRGTFTVSGITYDSATRRAINAPMSVKPTAVEPPLPSNTSPNEDGGSNETGDSQPPKIPKKDSKINFDRVALKQQKRTVPLRYPYAEIHNTTDYLQIGVVNYKSVRDNRNEGESIVGKPGSRRNRGKDLLATIYLPIPSNIQDTNAVSYSDPSSLNNITAALVSGGITSMEGLAEAFSQLISGNTLGADSKFKGTVSQLKEIVGQSGLDFNVAQNLLTKQLAASAASVFGGNVSINQLLARQEGVIFNPNMELLFNGPTLRSFQFSFKFTPRSQREAEEVKQIINTFKRNMAPQTVTSGGSQNLFIKTPNIFELTYKQGNQPHSFLHKFKQCFLENVSVNYTGEGTYATYGDGAPISMVMNLQFKELEPIYDIDYEDVYSGPLANSEKAFRSTGVGY